MTLKLANEGLQPECIFIFLENLQLNANIEICQWAIVPGSFSMGHAKATLRKYCHNPLNMWR